MISVPPSRPRRFRATEAASTSPRGIIFDSEFVDDIHVHEQLGEWMATIADARLYGATHERPAGARIVRKSLWESARTGATDS